MLTEKFIASLSLKLLVAFLIFSAIVIVFIYVHYIAINRNEKGKSADVMFFVIVFFSLFYWIAVICWLVLF